jgi:hypothetical protein
MAVVSLLGEEVKLESKLCNLVSEFHADILDEIIPQTRSHKTHSRPSP